MAIDRDAELAGARDSQDCVGSWGNVIGREEGHVHDAFLRPKEAPRSRHADCHRAGPAMEDGAVCPEDFNRRDVMDVAQEALWSSVDVRVGVEPDGSSPKFFAPRVLDVGLTRGHFPAAERDGGAVLGLLRARRGLFSPKFWLLKITLPLFAGFWTRTAEMVPATAGALRILNPFQQTVAE